MVEDPADHVQESNDTEEPADDNHEELADEELPGPLVGSVGEESEAQVGEHERLGSEPECAEGQVRGLLGLGRQVVPGVVGHQDTRGQQRDDAGYLQELSDHVAEVGRAKHEQSFMNW